MTALAIDGHDEAIPSGHKRAAPRCKRSDCEPRLIVHAIDLVDFKSVEKALFDHDTGSAAALLGRLEYQNHLSREIPLRSKTLSSCEQHRCVTVVTARMHHVGNFRGIRQIGLFRHWQRVHVATQTNPLTRSQCPLDNSDDTRLCDTGDNLVA